MVRTPEGPEAREIPVTTRFSAPERATLDEQRAARGGMSRSGYIRWLIAQDGKRIRREQKGR